MKKVILVFFILTCFKVSGQGADTIFLDFNTTVHLIFSSNVLSNDLGSGQYQDPETGEWVTDVNVDVVGKRVKVTPSIEYFEDTNLFIETERAYYNFILVYQEGPKKHIHPIKISDAVSEKEEVQVVSGSSVGSNGIPESLTSDEEMYRLSYLAATKEGRVIVGDESSSIRMWIDGVYVNGLSDKIFVTLSIYNKKNIVYDWGYTGFFIRAKGNKTIKNEVVQEEPVNAVYVYNETVKQVESEEIVKRVYVFDKFTIDKKKILSIELWENEGERKVILELGSKDLLDAERI